LFAQESIEYLGHIIFRDGVSPVPEKIHTMLLGQHLPMLNNCADFWDWQVSTANLFIIMPL